MQAGRPRPRRALDAFYKIPERFIDAILMNIWINPRRPNCLNLNFSLRQNAGDTSTQNIAPFMTRRQILAQTNKFGNFWSLDMDHSENQRNVERIEDCYFYHSIDLPDYGTVDGDWDLRGMFDQYIGNVDVSGRTMLDVATASGFLTFEAEKRGATVLSFDAKDATQFNLLPTHEIRTNPAPVADCDRRVLDRLKNSYWFSHKALNSKAQAFYGDIHDIPASIGDFDIVLIAQVLVHLRDPLGALTSAAARCKDTLIITEGMSEEDAPVARFLGSDPRINQAWWHLSTGLYRAFLNHLGFEIESITFNNYPCSAKILQGSIRVGTIVARRVQD